MKSTFLGHAGYMLQSGREMIAVDPWLYSSSIEKPLIQGLLPSQTTVDFQMRETLTGLERFKPRAVLISHFHTHHSPLREILHFAEVNEHSELQVFTPPLSLDDFKGIQRNLGELSTRIRVIPLERSGEVFTIENLKIRGYFHTQMDHVAWFVEDQSSSFFHLCDSSANRHHLDSRLDPVWFYYEGLKPSFAAITVGSHMMKLQMGARRWIAENTTFSPAQGARLVQLLNPKAVTCMGIGNTSHWTGRVEVSLPLHVAHDLFQWAVEYLSPTTRYIRQQVGDELDLSLIEPRTVYEDPKGTT